MYEYSINANAMAKDKLESLKCCKNLAIAGEISGILGTAGAVLLSNAEAAHTLGKYALTPLIVGGIAISIVNAKEIYENDKQLKKLMNNQ